MPLNYAILGQLPYLFVFTIPLTSLDTMALDIMQNPNPVSIKDVPYARDFKSKLDISRLNELCNSTAGLRICNNILGCPAVCDDMLLDSLSKKGLQELMRICFLSSCK